MIPAKPILDDRGQPVTVRDLGQMARTRVVPTKIHGLDESSMPSANLGLLVSVVVAIGGSILAAWMGMPDWVIVAGFVIAVLSYRMFFYRGHTRVSQWSRRLMQHALVHGICPSCLYSLVGAPVQGDLCVECPECAAAWDARRFVVAVPKDKTKRRAKLIKGMSATIPLHRSLAMVDDRGRLTVGTCYRVPTSVVTRSEYAERLARAARAGLAPFEGKRVLSVVVCFAVGIVAYAVALRFGGGTTLSNVVSGIVGTVAIASFGAGFVMVFGGVRVDLEQLRADILPIGLCPTCWEQIDQLEPNSDGCTTCASCGSAWRLSATPS